MVSSLLAQRIAAHRPDVPIVVITLDPWRDTPEQLATIATHWDLAPGDRVLSGSVAEVEHALDALGIGRRRDGNTGDIEHTATVMILDSRGGVAWRADGGWSGIGGVLRIAETKWPGRSS